MKIFLTLLFVLALIAIQPMASPSQAATVNNSIDFPAIDAYIMAQMKKHGLKGISLALTQGEEIVYLKGYGTAGNDRPMTPQTPMYIGSQSKSFTGLAVAQLAEAGKIDLNATVQTYLPSFEVADPVASQKITLSHLLHHTSGLSEEGFTAVLPENATNREAVTALASARLTAPVGVRHQYFNVGYDVLAVIVEQVSGKSYEAYIRENIFQPLDMTLTFTDPEEAKAAGLSQGYSRFFGFTVPRRQPHRVYEVSAGYIISTAEDMAHYAIAMNNDGVYNGERLLSSKWMDVLFNPVQGYAMGWIVQPGHINHGGANETFKTYVDLYPPQDLGIVLLINQGYMLDHYISAEQVFDGVSRLALGREPLPVSAGWSVRLMGWILGGFVLCLAAFHVRNILALRSWSDRSRGWSRGKLAWDIAISFLIPTLILVIVFWQVKGFYGTRFNFTYQLVLMFSALTDISLLMVIGTVPDYLQGIVKLYLFITGRRTKGRA